VAFTVGGVGVTTISGQYQRDRQKTEIFAARGLDGHGMQTMGLTGARFEFTVSFYALESAHSVWINAIEQLQGTIGDVTDPLDESFLLSCYFQRVHVPEKVAGYTGSAIAVSRIQIEGVVLGVSV
jgi:hypothetical protein